MSKAEKRYRGIYFATVVLGLVSALFMARFSFSLGKVIDVVLDPTESLQKPCPFVSVWQRAGW